MAAVRQTVEHVESLEKYKHGFVTDIQQDFAPKGLNADIVRFISAKKSEPEWMLEWRLEAFERWLALEEPSWAKVSFPRIDYQDSYYYAAPKQKVGPKSLDEVDPDLLETYKKLGIPLREQEVLAGVEGAPRYAVDAVFDSVSVVTTFKKELAQAGVIFCSMSEAIREHPELVQKYLGTVVPVSDKYSAVQNWYPGDPETGKGGIYNFVTKRADCRGDRSKVSWTQVETGSSITWKYPSCVLRGEGSSGEFYSIAITNGRQQADTGTK